MAMAVFPVPGWPAIRTALPAILPSYKLKIKITEDYRAWCLKQFEIYKIIIKTDPNILKL